MRIVGNEVKEEEIVEGELELLFRCWSSFLELEDVAGDSSGFRAETEGIKGNRVVVEEVKLIQNGK